MRCTAMNGHTKQLLVNPTQSQLANEINRAFCTLLGGCKQHGASP